jgi:hypothetical protein
VLWVAFWWGDNGYKYGEENWRFPGARCAKCVPSACDEAIFPLLSVVPAGCSIHPVQQDVTGVPPVEIIHHIRCETRLAIQDKAIELLQNDPAALLLVQRLKETRGKSCDFVRRANLPNADERKFYDRYIQTGIAYDFTLDITEENRASLSADPVRLITNGMAGVGLDAASDFSRNNARRFIMSDTFANLLNDRNPNLICGDRPSNFETPISIGPCTSPAPPPPWHEGLFPQPGLVGALD